MVGVPAFTTKVALPAADCLPEATATQPVPDFQTCANTARPTRTGPNVSVAVATFPVTNVAGSARDAVCATTRNVLVEVTYWARALRAIVTRGANVRTEYDPAAGALNLVAYEPVRVVLVLATVTQRVPDLRCTHTGRETAPGTLPVALTLSPLIAVEGDNERVALTTAA